MAPSSAEDGRPVPAPPEPQPGSTLSVLPLPEDNKAADDDGGDGGDVMEDVVDAEEDDVEEVEEVAGIGMVEAAPNQTRTQLFCLSNVLFFKLHFFLYQLTHVHTQTHTHTRNKV